MNDPGGRLQDLAYEAEGYRRAGDVHDDEDQMPDCKTPRCGHAYTDHDREGWGHCNAQILTVRDTVGHCQCYSYDRWGE